MGSGMVPAQNVSHDERLEAGERYLDLRLQGWSLRRIAVQEGVSAPTVMRRLNYALAWRIDPKVKQLRAIEDARLDRIVNRLETIAHSDSEEVRVEHRIAALNGLLKTVEKRARLHGLDVPVVAQVSVTHDVKHDGGITFLGATPSGSPYLYHLR